MAMKKLLAIFLSLAIVICGSFAGVNTYADQDQDDDYGNAISMYLTDSTGDIIEGKTGLYTVGQDYFYFKIDVYAYNLKNRSVVRKINFMNDDETATNSVSNFEYFDGTDWVDATQKYRGTKTDTSPTEVVQKTGDNYIRYRAKFNNTQQYLLEYSVLCQNPSTSINTRKFIRFKDGKFTISKTYIPEETPQEITHTIYIDGEEVAEVNDGGKYLTPSSSDIAEYGFYEKVTKKLYRRAFQISNITTDLSFESIDEINISNTYGANIRCDGIHGIRFGDQQSVKTSSYYRPQKDITEKLLKDGIMQMGTILMPQNEYVYYFDEIINKQNVDNMDPNCEHHYDVLNPSDDWPIDTTTHLPKYGTCYAGITHIKEYNIDRVFMASAYVQMEYQDYGGRTYTEYRNSENYSQTIRSIQQVATNMKNGGYQGTTQEMYWINYYYNWD